MKRVLMLLALLFCGVAYAATETINWYMDENTYATTTCQIGGDITLPTTPTKRGYTFQGWTGYTPIKYLESTGTQYIDTEYIPNIGTKFEIRVQILKARTQDFAGLSAISIGGNNTFFAPLTVASNKCVYYFNSYHMTQASCRVEDIITASIYVTPTKAQIIQNNETLNITNTYNQDGVFIPTHSLYLFAGHYLDNNNNGPFAGEFSTARMFYAKIWQNNTLVRDFIPVLDGNGTPCMFDKVEKKFYYNAGTGQFIAGPVVNE